MSPDVILAGVQVGIKAMEAWNEYIANLYAKQKEREANGEVLTMLDVDTELEQVHAKIRVNAARIGAKLEAYERS